MLTDKFCYQFSNLQSISDIELAEVDLTDIETQDIQFA